jgi:hypothetical protein
VALGRTHYHWTPPVRRVVQRTLRSFPRLSANTYRGHPFPGWGPYSIDFWGLGGRGDPISSDLAWSSADFLLNLEVSPKIRHIIVEHSIWTSWGGWSEWRPDDHDGAERHTHITYWK